MKKTTNEKTTIETTINTIINNETLSKSKKMIQLYDMNIEIKQISILMGVRYNFVYNVISNYTRINDIELRTKQTTDSKKSLIIDLIKQNKTNNEISQLLKTNYQYVFKIRKEYELLTKKVVNE